MKSTDQELISIVTPVYNAAVFLDDTIKSVQDQTYTNWELILVDDGSKDESIEIIKRHQINDERIKLLQMDQNSGAALARNMGIDNAKGTYLAFLDADDLWSKDKLTKQIRFMTDKDCAFSFTGYEFADSQGTPNGKRVYVPDILSYSQALKNTTISTITVMFDLSKINKDKIYMPDVKSEDTATWWAILKEGYVAYGLNEILSYYRRTSITLSSNKVEAAKRTWHLYTQVQKLSLPHSIYYFCWYAFNATRRRL